MVCRFFFVFVNRIFANNYVNTAIADITLIKKNNDKYSYNGAYPDGVTEVSFERWLERNYRLPFVLL